MEEYHYIGLDVHKKVIAYCIKNVAGKIVDEGSVAANRRALGAWAAELPRPWLGAMEATLFTGWIYDFLLPHAEELKVAHSYMLRAICAAKKKNDRVDARKLADALRCDLLPECYMAPAELLQLLRELVNPTNRYDQAVGQTAFKTMRMPSEDGMGILHIIALWPVRMFDLNEALELVVKQLMAVGSAA